MSIDKSYTLVQCYHCGEDCKEGVTFFDSKSFCCEGCKTVYDLLQTNDMCYYYETGDRDPQSVKLKSISDKKFEYLDEPEVIEKLVSKSGGKYAKVTFSVPQIHCSSCIYLLENLYKIKKGVNRSTVNFLKREVNITFDTKELSLKQLVSTLASLGYEPQISLENLDNSKKTNPHSHYYKRIAVAFFCFGNMMLLSFPEYLGISSIYESTYRHFFGYLNFLLALPVIFYSASDFFKSAFLSIKHRSLNMDLPIVLGILAMFGRSTYEVFWKNGGGYFDTLGSLVLLMLIGRLFQDKSYYRLSFDRDYKSYFPVSVSILKDGEEKNISLQKLKVGDTLLIRNEELIPADALLLSSHCSIDYSFVTGESDPVKSNAGERIYAGGRLVGSSAEFIVEKDVSHSYLTQLWNDAAFKKEEQSSVSTLASKASYFFTPVVLVIAVAVFLYWFQTDLDRAFNAFTSILIITCPCALALSSPFALGNALRVFSSKNIYLKNVQVIEKMARVNTVVFDKTGTLTDTKKTAIVFQGDELTKREIGLLKSLLKNSTHPLSTSIYNSLPVLEVVQTTDFKEQPGKGIEGWINDCHVKAGSADFLAISTPSQDSGSKVYVSFDGRVKGYFVLKYHYRTGLKEMLDKLKSKFELFVLSGDNDTEKKVLGSFFERKENLVFNQKPEHKLQFIKSLSNEGKHVLMLGDGLNDAGALKQSEVGLVIAENVNNFSPACDGILESSAFADLPVALDYAKATVRVVLWSFGISALYNLVGIYFAMDGTMSPLIAAVLMPISSVTILLFTTISTRVLAPFYFKSH